MQVKELRNKSEKELLKLIDDLKAQLFMLRFRNATGQLEKPHKINLLKKDIARIFTVLNENKNEKLKSSKEEVKKNNNSTKVEPIIKPKVTTTTKPKVANVAKPKVANVAKPKVASTAKPKAASTAKPKAKGGK